jgi:LPS-assembly protein
VERARKRWGFLSSASLGEFVFFNLEAHDKRLTSTLSVFLEKELTVTMILPQSIGCKCLLILFACLALCNYPTKAFAEKAKTEEWQISADKITRFDNPQSIIAEGNVELIKLEKLPPVPPLKSAQLTDWSVLLEESPQKEETTAKDLEVKGTERVITKITIKADWIAYDVSLGTIKARGHIDIIAGDEKLVAEQAVVDLNRDTGTFTNATITRKKNQLHLEGKTVEKTGVNTYHIVDGWVITCKLENGEKPPWSFSGSDTKITQGGYAVMKNATFDIKGVPVLYSPYMVFPAKNARETGFLIPVISNSTNNGYGFNLPFFYNISDSADMTIFSEYYLKRGFMPGAEFRYVLKADDKGTLAANFIDDKLSDPSETKYYSDTGFTHTNSERYWIRGKIDKNFGNDWIARIDLDIVSDRDYLTEFNSGLYTGFKNSNYSFFQTYGRGFQNSTEDQRQNSISLLKSWTGMSLVTDLVGIDDVRITKDSPTPLWKLPGLDFTGSTPIRDSNFNFNWDANYVNYWRDEGIGGQRFDFYPKVSTPIPLGAYLESRAEFGLRETFYSIQTYGDGTWDQGDTPNRNLYNFHSEVGTTLTRDFDLPIGEFKGINHKLRPFVHYDYLPDVDQTKLPSFDRIDRIDPQNTITYGIDNFFSLFKNAKVQDISSTSDYSYFKIKQSYFLDDAISKSNSLITGISDEADKPLSPVNMKMGWRPISSLDVIYKTDLDVYGYGFITHGLESAYRNSRGDIFDIDYRYNKILDLEQINFHLKTQLLSNIAGEILFIHSLTQSQTNEQDISLTYQAPCWSVEMRSVNSPTDNGFMLIFNLSNISSPMSVPL